MKLFQVTAAATLTALLGGALAQDLTVYSGRSEDFIAPLVEQFAEETGLQVDVRYGNTAELAATLLEEGANSPADVFFPQDGGALGAVAREGLFAELPESVLERVESRFRSPEGLWVGVTGRARVLAYNTGSVGEEELPESVFELTEPQWQGRVGWAPTNASLQASVTAMRLLEGEEATREWLVGLIDNGAQVYEGNSQILEALGRGEIDAGITNHYYLYRFLEEQGEGFPVRNHYFSGGDVGSLINIAGVGVLASSDRTDTAEQFVAFLLSEEAQAYFTETVFEYPLVEGVATSELLLPLAEVETPELDLSNLDDLEATLELLEEVGAL